MEEHLADRPDVSGDAMSESGAPIILAIIDVSTACSWRRSKTISGPSSDERSMSMIQSANGADIISDARDTVRKTVLVTALPCVARDPVPAFTAPQSTLGRPSGDGQDAPGRRSV